MRLFALAAAAAITLAAAAPAAAQGVAGTWELTYTLETPRGTIDRTITVHLEQEGVTLTGTADMAMGRPGGGGAGGGTRSVDISNGMVADGEVMFTIAFGGGQRTFSMAFAGVVEGDTMTGTVTNARGDSPFTGTRKEG